MTNTTDLWDRHVSVSLDELNLPETTKSIIENIVNDYFPIDYTDIEKMKALSANKGTVIKYVVQSIDDLSLTNAQKLLFSVDSFNRPEILQLMSNIVSRDEWLSLFRDFWTQCDSCSLYHEEFKNILLSYKVDKVREKTHDEDDIAFYESLPETFKVYRGTFIDDRFAGGISWTTDRSVAEKFEAGYKSFANNGPMVYRYLINMTNDKFDLLKDISSSGTDVLSRTVSKADIFVNTSRGEYEIFVLGN